MQAANLTGTPVSLASPPSADVYRFIQITNDNLPDNSVVSVRLSFEVDATWLAPKGYDPSNVVLERYSDGSGWKMLSTRLISNEGLVLRYEADSPGLSLYAITADTTEARLTRAAQQAADTPTPAPAPTAAIPR